jgi:hypothetical protein
MKEVIDYLASVMVGGMVFMTLMQYYVGVGETSATQAFDNAVQENLTSAAQIMEYDFQKIGFGSTDSAKVSKADSASVIFKSDIDANGTVDTLTYFLGTAVAPASGVTRFKLSYYDAGGSKTSILKNIRSLKVALTLESMYGFDSTYPAVCWERTIRPRNLR